MNQTYSNYFINELLIIIAIFVICDQAEGLFYEIKVFDEDVPEKIIN